MEEELRISEAVINEHWTAGDGGRDRRAGEGTNRCSTTAGGGRGGGSPLVSVALTGTAVSCRPGSLSSLQRWDAMRGERGLRGANAQLQGRRGRRGEGRRAMASRRARTQRMEETKYPCGCSHEFFFSWLSCARWRLGSTPLLCVTSARDDFPSPRDFYTFLVILPILILYYTKIIFPSVPIYMHL